MCSSARVNLTAAGTAMMTNKFQYNAMDNILGITNAVDPTRGNTNGDKKLGGAFKHSYAYDDLNRLVYASGKAKQASYSMQMTFGRMSEPLTKVQKVDSTKTAQSYDFTYKYEDSNHPTAPTQIGHEHYTYDANGNPTLVENDSLNTERKMYWDEDNRLMVLSDNGKTCRYTYNAAGERIIKSHGDLEGVYINGAPQGITFHETEDYTIYPAPIITVTKNRFTKHYFIGDKRVASKLGVGKFSNVYGISGNNVTAGQKDYAARMMQIEKQREEYYKSLGTPPGVPTMKGATADPDNTGYGYNTIIGDLGDHSVPEGWVQRPKFNDKGDVPGPPIQWQKPEDPDNAQPGYGYIPTDTTNIEEIFFYHSDHLGSTSYITDAKANITQFDAYLPYGELLVDEHTSSEDMPYKFNGKELDQETGLYYYGARYMNPVTSLWYGVDPMAEKMPEVCSYLYCLGNPIQLIDPDGNQPKSSDRTLFYNTIGTSSIEAALSIGATNKYKGLYFLAQRRVENGFNTKVPANNPMNIKGKGDAGVQALATTEYIGGKAKKMKQNFAKFSTVEEGFKGYLNVLKKNFPSAYAALLDDNKTINDFTNGLESGTLGGYATAPDYSAQIKRMFDGIVCDYKKQINTKINKNNTLIGEYQSEIIKAQKSEQGHSNSDIMKLKQKIAVLNNENKKLKNDLKQLNSLK